MTVSVLLGNSSVDGFIARPNESLVISARGPAANPTATTSS